MKFQLVINIERMSLDVDMCSVKKHTLEMMQMADAGGSRSCERLKNFGIENDYRSQSFLDTTLV
jgi:hypothetical protein